MKVYNKQHAYYCGIDLHARKMYICILNSEGKTVYHKNRTCNPESFLDAVAPFRDNLVVGVECIFCWYWLADLCQREGIDFILGHALYMKSIHGLKTKNDRIDSLKIARLIRGGNFPIGLHLLQSIRGVGDVLSLTILYEIGEINRFAGRGEFCSYARLVKGQKSSNGKIYGTTGGRIGNAHLRWAFSEAALLYVRGNDLAGRYYQRLSSRHGKGKALTIIAKRLGTAVYYMLKRKEPFDEYKFLGMEQKTRQRI